MKKVVTILTTIVLVIGITSCTKKESKQTEALKFKQEYESLNNQKKSSGNGNYSAIEIPEDNAIVYSNVEEILSILEDKTGVIYFGYAECPWCRLAVPVLLNTANMVGIDKIYYLDVKDMRDSKKLDENGTIVTEKEGSAEYKDLLKALDSILPVYKDLNDETLKRIYVPMVLFVQNGEILGFHEGTVDSQTDPNVLLTSDQEKELSSIYSDYMHKILGDVCDESC